MMGDRLGPRRVLTRIVAWWSAFTALTGAMTSYYPLLLTRFLFIGPPVPDVKSSRDSRLRSMRLRMGVG